MACPLFLPSSPVTGVAREAATLGDIYNGVCEADPTAAIPLDILRTCCNQGYARSRCDRAGQSDADSVRFLIKARDFTGIDVAWALERNHHPVATGLLKITPLNQAENNQQIPALEQQARAYIRSHLS